MTQLSVGSPEEDWFHTWKFELRVFSESLIVEDDYDNVWQFIKTADPGMNHSKFCETLCHIVFHTCRERCPKPTAIS